MIIVMIMTMLMIVIMNLIINMILIMIMTMILITILILIRMMTVTRRQQAMEQPCIQKNTVSWHPPKTQRPCEALGVVVGLVGRMSRNRYGDARSGEHKVMVGGN